MDINEIIEKVNHDVLSQLEERLGRAPRNDELAKKLKYRVEALVYTNYFYWDGELICTIDVNRDTNEIRVSRVLKNEKPEKIRS